MSSILDTITVATPAPAAQPMQAPTVTLPAASSSPAGGTLMHASRQWATRPADERFTSLVELRDFKRSLRDRSVAKVVSSRALSVRPAADNPNKGLEIVGQNGTPATMSHWSFGQLAQLAGAPAGYLRKLHPALAADNLNYGLKVLRDVEDVGVLLTKADAAPVVIDGVEFAPPALPVLRAATGPNYGRIWDGGNNGLMDFLVDRFGDGVSGDWRVPGEFGNAIEITKANTTFYGSDRDVFVFLADEVNRVTMPNRRNGSSGTLARGFFLSNSEVGAGTLTLHAFLFDYACKNRIVWGAEGVQKIAIRHTAGGPDRWREQAMPAIEQMARTLKHQASAPVVDVIKAAQDAKLERIDDFLANRFGKGLVATLHAVHKAEEERPIETAWDAITAATAHARGMEHQDARVELETKAGAVMEWVSRNR